MQVLGSVGEHLLQPGTVVINKSEEQQAKLSELRVKEEAHPVQTFWIVGEHLLQLGTAVVNKVDKQQLKLS